MKRTIQWVIITVVWLAASLGLAAFLFPQQALTIDSGNVTGDTMVVLGGGDGRAEWAAELYKEGVAPRVLVTGYGDGDWNTKLLIQGGVPAQVIIQEPKALTTLENAEFSIPILRKMGATRVVLVTSWFHSRRALACFEHVAPDLVFYSRPSYQDYQKTNLNRGRFNEHVNFEYVKLLGYIFTHGVLPFPIK